jgi:hypothetical protein
MPKVQKMTQRKGKLGRQKPLQLLGWLAGCVALCFTGGGLLYVYIIIGHGKVGFANKVDEYPCGDGTYKLVGYEYNNGDGYVELVARSGEKYGKASFSAGISAGPFYWTDDCKSVLVHTDSDPVRRKVK